MTKAIDYNKLRGGYYTPEAIAAFLANWVISSAKKSVLEPSSGDGVFVEAAAKRLKSLDPKVKISNKNILGIEIDPKEAKKTFFRLGSNGFRIDASVIVNSDFFTFARDNLIDKKKFDGVIGNPPFIRYQNFVTEYREIALGLMKNLGMNPNKLTNIWVPFLVIASELLNHGGRIGMVIPAELFQVKYAAETREHLTNIFSKINLITFKSLLFQNIQQEIVLFLGEKNGGGSSKISVIELENKSDLATLNIDNNPDIEEKEMMHSAEKWTYYFLSRDDIEFMQHIKNNYGFGLSGDFIDVDVGVVTGRNKFFVLKGSQVAENELNDYVSRIVARSAHLKGISFNENDWEVNKNTDYPMYLLMPPSSETAGLSNKLKNYIAFGENQSVHKGYKCSIRKKWYIVPSVWTPDAFLLRQVHDYPKLIINTANATCTDTIHRVRIKNGVNKNQLAAAMLNSLTFAFSEVIGRSYGGGVMTFEPSESELFPIPIQGMNNLNFQKIDKLIRKDDIEAVLDITDKVLLVEGLGMTKTEASRLRNIWKKLRDRRNNRKHKQK